MQEYSNNCMSVSARQTSIFLLYLFISPWKLTKSHIITYVLLFRCQFALADTASTFKFYLNKLGETRTPTEDSSEHPYSFNLGQYALNDSMSE